MQQERRRRAGPTPPHVFGPQRPYAHRPAQGDLSVQRSHQTQAGALLSQEDDLRSPEGPLCRHSLATPREIEVPLLPLDSAPESFLFDARYTTNMNYLPLPALL